MPPPRILLIDDHAMFRSGLAVLLRMCIAELEVTEASSLDESLHVANEAPDLVLLDILLRGLNGIDGIELLKRKWPQTHIVMVSSDAAPETVRQAMARGATAFVSKEKSAENILSVVQSLLKPDEHSSESVPAGVSASHEAARLTPRQLEVLDLLCQGLPNKAIGRKLDLSENTVRWHVQGILAFLKVSNRSEAAFAARSKGVVG
jgi:DNA-binding NarL/FixJ family response regulator